MKYIKIILLISFIFCFYNYLFSQDLILSKNVNMGGCYVGVDNRPAIKMYPFPITNNTNQNIYLREILLFNDIADSITKKGNYFSATGIFTKYTSSEIIIKPTDTYYISLWYYSQYLDPVSKNGYLNARLTLEYRIGDSLNLYYDTVNIQAKSIDSALFFSYGENYYSFEYCPSALNDSNIQKFTIDLYNKTNKKIIIDSITNEFDGINLTPKGLLTGSIFETNNIYSLPFKFDSNSYVRYLVLFNTDSYTTKKCKTKFYYKYENELNENILIDSIIYKINKSIDAKLINQGSVIKGYLNHTTIDTNCILFNGCSNNNFVVDSIAFSNDWKTNEIMFLLNDNLSYPFSINSDSKLFIGSIKFSPKELGIKNGFLIAYLRTENDSTFKRIYSQQTFCYNDQSVFYSYSLSKKNDISYYIDNNQEILHIIIKEAEKYYGNAEIGIYNILGNNIAEYSLQADNIDLPITNLEKGVYFVRIKYNNNYYAIKFLKTNN